jgi:hypothetical protein
MPRYILEIARAEVFLTLSGVCLDPIDNTLVFNDCHNHNVKRIALDGTIEILAGSPDGEYGYVDGMGTIVCICCFSVLFAS